MINCKDYILKTHLTVDSSILSCNGTLPKEWIDVECD